MMYEKLYQFLIQYKQLSIPGIGTFLLERKPAQGDLTNKKMNPPAYTIALHSTVSSPSRKFYSWLANGLHISDRDAWVRFNDFVFEMIKQISAGDSIYWNGVGTLSRGPDGEIIFVSGVIDRVVEKPLAAEKIIRGNAMHMVRVGEDEKTSAEMRELLNRRETKKSFWWVRVLALTLLASLLTGWYFSQHGSVISSTANRQKLVPQEATAAFTIRP